MKICDLIPREMTGFRFHISPENLTAAFEAAQKYCDDFEDMNSLTEVFANFGFSAEADAHGIGELGYCFSPEKDTLDLINFIEAIAPFVKAGSYIEMAGTEGAAWRWVFDGKKVSGSFPVDFIWPSQPLEESFFLGFYQTSRQDYWENMKKDSGIFDEIIFGIHNELGGIACELAMRWYDIGGELSPRLEMFVESIPPMETQALMRVVQSATDYGNKLTPEDFCKCLKWLGYKDLSDIKPE